MLIEASVNKCPAPWFSELLLRSNASAIEVKKDVHDAFNVKVDASNQLMAWGVPQVTSWYKNARGRVSQNWPYPLVDYWSATRKPSGAKRAANRASRNTRTGSSTKAAET